MRLKRLLLHDVGPFADLDLTFREGTDPGKADIHMFVGPNGSGKSTLLYALAQMFSYGVPLIAPRFRSSDSYVAIEADDHAMAVLHERVRQVPERLNELLGERSLGPTTGNTFVGQFQYRDRPLNPFIDEYRSRASEVKPESDYPTRGARAQARALRLMSTGPTRLTFAAFAYSGSRTVGSYALEAIQEPTGDPLEGALSFVSTADSRKLTQWIANTRAKQALAAARGDEELAEKRADTIAKVEDILGGIVEREIRFVLEEDPLAVKLVQNGVHVELDVLPDGLKSILSWIADVLMRLDRLPWRDDTPILERSFVLLLDEIEIHLHPAWQRRVLPVVQDLFPNAQVFLSTHSPFVVGSASDAWIYPLTLQDGNAVAGEPLPSRVGYSYPTILSEVFGITQEFDVDTEDSLGRFYELRNQRLAGDENVEAELAERANELRSRSVEVRDIVEREMRQLRRRVEQGA